MFKIAILGCENSHADGFLDLILNEKVVTDVEVVGVYSDERDAALKLHERFGVAVADRYDEYVGKIDGLIVTARNGANHYKFAKPYIESGIPMFIDKPITNDENEAVEFMKHLKANNIRVCGGSCCSYAKYVGEIKELVASKKYGELLGGHLRAPVNMVNPHGGFVFYAQHLAQVLCSVFGYYPKSVRAYQNDNMIKCVFRYDKYDVTGEYVESKIKFDVYYLGVSLEKDFIGSSYNLDNCSKLEFMEFYNLLKGGAQPLSYNDFIAPVAILNALERSLNSGKDEVVNVAGEI